MKDLPLIRSLKSAVAGTLLVSLPLILLSATPLTGVYAVVLAFYLLPAAVCLTAAVCGVLPAAVNACAGIYAMHALAGKTGLLLSALYVLPILLAFLLVMRFRFPFFKSCGLMIVLHLFSLAGSLVILQNLSGGNLYVAAGEAVVSFLEDWEMGDTMLYQFYSMGLLALPESLSQDVIRETIHGYVLNADARKDLLLSLQSTVEMLLKGLIPTMIIQQSILGGVGTMLLPIRFGTIAEERRAFKSADPAVKAAFPDLGMQPLSLWHLPRGMGWKVGLAYVSGSLLRGIAATVPLAMAGMILYSAAYAVFTIQGAALLNFIQKSKGTRRFWRVVLPALLLSFSLLPYLGIFDQIINIRGLRQPPETKEDH